MKTLSIEHPCRLIYRAIVLVIIGFLLAACNSLGVKPWERGTLALAEMEFGSSAVDDVIDDHLYFSKEASSGGGCGCS